MQSIKINTLTVKTLITILLFISIAYAKEEALSVVTKAEQTKPSVEEQIQAQLNALKKANSAPKIKPKLITSQPGYRLWAMSEHVDPLFSQSLDAAYRLFEQRIGKPETIEVLLLDNKLQMATVDRSEFVGDVLMLPKEVIASKQSRGNSTAAAVVNHEACHKWLISIGDQAGIARPAMTIKLPAYGHPGIPDWFDETVAVMCEFGELSESRLLKSFDEIPLATYLTMEHPTFAQIKQQVMAALAQNNKMNMVKLETEESDHIHFYYQSAWIDQFLREQLGNQYLSDLIEKMSSKQDLQDYLLERSKKDTIEDLTDQFVEYIAKNRKHLLSEI